MEILDRLLALLQYNPKEPLLFTSGMFLFAMLFFTLGYFLLRRKLSARLIYVTLFSYYFFYKNSGGYFLLLAVVTASDFIIAQRIARLREEAPCWSRRWLWASLLIDLGLLAYFKYTNFFAGLIAQIIRDNFQPWDIFLPVGISFFTFKSISYVVDVYRGKVQPLTSLLDYAFYVSFFPVLLAGPIVRAKDFVPQIRKPLSITNEMFARGVWFIIVGLFKKAIISDYISINFVNRVFDMPSMFSGGEILLGMYGYSVQLYCDFSGYSDMAIGVALLLGFTIPANFNAPYKADSLSDFWRRWHISLSSWIKDYVYISLGGNRRGKCRMYLNQLIAMTLCGLWHGASLNFVLWGLFHGIGVCVHKLFSQGVLRHDRHYHPPGWRRVGAVVLTFHLVTFLWIFFRVSDIAQAWQMIVQLFTRFNVEILPQVLVAYRYVFLFMTFALLCHFAPAGWQKRVVDLLGRVGVMGCAVALTFVVYLVIQVRGSEVQPFIYFQF